MTAIFIAADATTWGAERSKGGCGKNRCDVRSDASSGRAMKMTLIGMAFVGASLAVWGASGCGKKEASCDAVFEHVKALAPADMREMVDATRDAAMSQCEKLSAEQRRCVVEAADL